MKIGVADTGGRFQSPFFKDKNITILHNKISEETSLDFCEITHGEYVCATILKENPKAEIILVPIIRGNMKCSVQDMIDGIELLIEKEVDVINLSMGDEYKYHAELEHVCEKAWNKGIMIVAAHANRQVKATYPANFPFVIGVRSDKESGMDKLMKFDKEKNDIIFSMDYTSIYQLGRAGMIPGNSFICAKITGLVSCHKNKYEYFLGKLIASNLNNYYPYSELKIKTSIFLTNRMEDEMELRFMEEVTNSITCLQFGEEKIFNFNFIKHNFNVLFIDHDCYQEAIKYKGDIQRYAMKNRNVEIVLRYPLFSLEERYHLYCKNKITINQFYI